VRTSWVRWVAALLAVVVLGAGCGDNGDDASERLDTRDEADGTPDDAGITGTDPPPGGAIDLAGILLRPGDLPPDFVDSTGPDAEDDDSLCEGHDPSAEHPNVDEEFVELSRSETGTFVAHIVGRWEDAGAAERFMAGMREALEACGDYEDDGVQMRFSEAAFPSLGDDTLAMDLVGTELDAVVIEGSYAVVRVGPLVSIVVVGSIHGASNDIALESLAATVADRMAAAAA
jgi:hypothetical protein